MYYVALIHVVTVPSAPIVVLITNIKKTEERNRERGKCIPSIIILRASLTFCSNTLFSSSSIKNKTKICIFYPCSSAWNLYIQGKVYSIIADMAQ